MTFVALGCSHTAGVGVDSRDCYVSVLGSMLNQPFKNLGVPGGNAGTVQATLIQELVTQAPDFVIAQWPNPVRLTVWHGARAHNENIKNASTAFTQLLKQSVENFYQPWIQTIIVCDLLCRQAGIPIIHIMLEDLDAVYNDQLIDQSITLHQDQKLPGSTWLFDSAASDNLHHSAMCHKQWAERLFGLINEHTTR